MPASDDFTKLNAEYAVLDAVLARKDADVLAAAR